MNPVPIKARKGFSWQRLTYRKMVQSMLNMKPKYYPTLSQKQKVVDAVKAADFGKPFAHLIRKTALREVFHNGW